MRILWVYAYQIVPPQPSRRLGTIRALLETEIAAARGDARMWSGRLVLERRATHILIVSDGPGQHDSINRRLEGELSRLEAAFSVTEPLAVVGQPEGSAPTNGNGRGLAPTNGNGHGLAPTNGNGHGLASSNGDG